MKTHKELYKLTTSINNTEAMNANELTHAQSVSAVNALRQHVRTLINTVYDVAKNADEIKGIAKMYQRIDEVKEKVFKDAVYDKVCKDYDSITSSDARKGDVIEATMMHIKEVPMDIHPEDADPDVFNA